MVCRNHSRKHTLLGVRNTNSINYLYTFLSERLGPKKTLCNFIAIRSLVLEKCWRMNELVNAESVSQWYLVLHNYRLKQVSFIYYFFHFYGGNSWFLAGCDNSSSDRPTENNPAMFLTLRPNHKPGTRVILFTARTRMFTSDLNLAS